MLVSQAREDDGRGTVHQKRSAHVYHAVLVSGIAHRIGKRRGERYHQDAEERRKQENGQEGVLLVERFRPDIILLDLTMPVMTGDEALAEIRRSERGRDIPVMILTNLGEEEAPKSLHRLGIHSYIVKADLTPRQVVARVKDALGITD